MITKTDMSIEEAAETLTGFEEQEIEKRFGAILEELLASRPTFGMRALAMVLVHRELAAQDVRDPKGKAFEHVMGFTLKQVGEFFPEADEEGDDGSDSAEERREFGLPVTPVGEGGGSAD